jgi:hypothetical protein
MKTIIFITAFAAASLMLPNVSQVVVGAATTTAKVGDVVRVGVQAEQVDAGLTELTVAVPYTPGSLQYAGIEGTGLTANNVVVSPTQGSVNVKWTGTMAPGANSTHLGYVLF